MLIDASHHSVCVSVCLQTAGIFEYLWNSDSDTSASRAHPDLASEGASQGKTGLHEFYRGPNSFFVAILFPRKELVIFFLYYFLLKSKD